MRAALLAIALIAGWEAYADLGNVDEFILPAPSAVARSLTDDRGLLWTNFQTTAGEVLLGILVALAIGFVLALVIHLSPAVRRTAYPLVVASQTIPVVIVAPLLVAWLGFDLAPKLAIVALVCFFPVVVTTLDALARVDPAQRALLRTLDAGRWQMLRHLELPSALPGMLSGAKIAVSVAVIGAVLAEQAGSSDGLGHLILQAIPQLDTARAYAAVVVLSVFAIALFAILTLLERRLVPWAARNHQSS